MPRRCPTDALFLVVPDPCRGGSTNSSRGVLGKNSLRGGGNSPSPWEFSCTDKQNLGGVGSLPPPPPDPPLPYSGGTFRARLIRFRIVKNGLYYIYILCNIMSIQNRLILCFCSTDGVILGWRTLQREKGTWWGSCLWWMPETTPPQPPSSSP